MATGVRLLVGDSELIFRFSNDLSLLTVSQDAGYYEMVPTSVGVREDDLESRFPTFGAIDRPPQTNVAQTPR